MTEQLHEIGGRLRALRQIVELGEAEFAEKLGIDVGVLRDYEEGKRDFSFSFLYNAAGLLGVDVVDLMSGDSPKLSTCSLVRKGGGYAIDRRAAYSYHHLAFTFKRKKAEPFMVTVERQEEGDKPTLHSHTGQEFNYVVSGRIAFHLGDIRYELSEGDSVYFDSETPHAMRALDGKSAQFLAVVLG